MLDDSKIKLKKECVEELKNFIKLLSHALTDITIFQAENNHYDTEFIMNGSPLRMDLHHLGRVVNGFLAYKKQKAGTLYITGLVTDAEEEKDIQIKTYKLWHQRAIELTGKLQIPEDAFAKKLQKKKQKKESRVQTALESIPPPTTSRETNDSRPKEHRPISPIPENVLSSASYAPGGLASIRASQDVESPQKATRPIELAKIDQKLRGNTPARNYDNRNVFSPSNKSDAKSILVVDTQEPVW